ncbi:Lon protease 1 [Aedoeadaptatus ivorii]|uniref:Lon protease n=1 Tax=Aedoeadaptatus ivorii TaxID=54006 RepID=A0A3S5AJW0_9FIRM|nr:endopeptidase La [Peptoniphilus ivorii]VEJ35994.1 Lon protease 1 [Peptoniphilus ivorii]
MATVKKREAFPLLALRDMVILPHVITHFDAARKKSVAAIERADAGDGYLFLTTQKDPDVEEPEIDDLYEIGTLVKINQILRLPGDIVRVLVEGHARGRIVASDFSDSYIRAQVDVFEEEEVDMDAEMEALLRMAEADLDEYIEKNNKIYPGLLDSVINYDTPQTFADTVAGYVNLRAEDAQSVLDAIDIKARLTTLHMVLSREIELLTIENAIDDKVKRNMSQSQKEYFLKEQMKVIRRELGEGGDEEEEIDNYREKLEEKALPDAVREKAEKELQKLGRMNSASPEYAGITNYLDWVLDLPWCEEAEEDYELAEARKILDDEHYGLKDIKERILEFIALRKKSSNAKSPILCLVGPPGVGKTSIAASVAKALKKPYVRMSLGGMTDESEIRGHRRTYIGSMPGRVLTLMKQAKKNNPLFLLDEIDKVGNDYRGDPASGLLEVLDPAQNNTFTDRYMEVPFDLSKVFFITTANTTKTIPAPLLDRMEIIRLGGYTPEEKREIATRHLWPKHLKDVGYDPEEITISDNAVDTVIESYTGEAGVRMLDKELAKIVRKVTLEYLERDKKRVQITNRNLSKYLGEKKALRDTVEEEDLVGYVNGLAWTSIGGVLLGIEVNIVPGKGKMQLTGQLGDVMKESAQAALSYIWSKSEEIGIPADFKEKHDIHIHVPDGATPKDGPSAGIAMTTALYSALTEKPVNRLVAMTGEVTLRGRVLPIGGLKEKLLAAQRAGVKTVLIPKANERELKEMDSPSIARLTIIPVESMEAVIKEAIADGH